MPTEQPDLKVFEATIVSRASRDDVFRDELMAKPKEVLARELSKLFPQITKLPDRLNIKVVEQSKDTIYLVLNPRASTYQPDELMDEELDMAAGGYPSPTCNGATCAAATQGEIC